jgi:hypothetical protein
MSDALRAKSKRSGERCKRHASIGRTVCRMHGGATPRGPDHPSWRGRGYSKDLPTQLRDGFVVSVDDPDLSSCRNELALIDAKLGDLFEQGVTSVRGWERVFHLVDLRRRVANTEARREATLMNYLTPQQARALIGCLVQLILQEGPEVQKRMLSGLGRLMAEQGMTINRARIQTEQNAEEQL